VYEAQHSCCAFAIPFAGRPVKIICFLELLKQAAARELERPQGLRLHFPRRIIKGGPSINKWIQNQEIKAKSPARISKFEYGR
jgi:hypothetical protein